MKTGLPSRRRSRPSMFAFVALALSGGVCFGQTVNGAGATFPNPIYTAWIQQYAKTHSDVKITYQAVGSGAGYEYLKTGAADFAGIDVPRTGNGTATDDLEYIPTVAGAVVLAYNIPGVGPGLRLDGRTIAGIYLGYITTWNDRRIVELNPRVKLPKEQVHVICARDRPRTTYLLSSYLCRLSRVWKEKVGLGIAVQWPVGLVTGGGAGVEGMVKSCPYSIGCVEMAYAITNKLSFGPVKNRHGEFVTPSGATTRACVAAAAGSLKKDIRSPIFDQPGTGVYPLVSLTYIAFHKTSADESRADALREFLRWTLGPGQERVEDLYYTRLPKPVAERCLQILR